MADFVAVIRRAVDGLTDNTPEMRGRVYEKARSAVVRQLENMNPRPPEPMFKRQLDKLDAAIQQVEEENSFAVADDAAPAEATAEPAPVADHVTETVATHEQAVDAERHPEPAEAASEEHHPAEAFHGEPEPLHRGSETEAAAVEQAPPHDEHHDHYETVEHHQSVDASHDHPAFEADAAQAHADHDHGEEPTRHDLSGNAEHADQGTAIHGVEAARADHDDPLLSHFEPASEPAKRHAANRVMEQPYFDAESEIPGSEPAPRDHVAASEPAASGWGVDIDREPETFVEDETQAPPMPRASLTESDVASDFNKFVNSELATPAVKPPPGKETEEDFSWDKPFDDLPDLPKPVAFREALSAKQEELAKAPEQTAAQTRDPRSELEDLIGYTAADGTAGSDKQAPEINRGMSKLEGKSFKVHKKKQKFNPLPIAFGVAGALIVAGGAYGVYAYRDQVSALVASYMPSKADPAETRAVDGKTEATAEKANDPATSTSDDGATQAAATDAASEDKPTEVASLDPNIAAGKFTQRLMADGSETETDAAKLTVDQSLSEGKTIAGQTQVASANPASTAAEPAAQTPGLAVTQKMFLYEERLGGSPVAVPGTVTWSLKNDTSSSGSQEQPMVEATIEVPERKLKAVVSFKRNSDPSLPASHIIEIVFDLPDNFTEGNVESVQRVAFKQTEQDRGNSLIAVPAKITDDFHMIALNDDTDARKVNTDLMKTRSWIDIPVIYRNNRRALLTFEKGSTGTDAFDKAMARWAALAPTAAND